MEKIDPDDPAVPCTIKAKKFPGELSRSGWTTRQQLAKDIFIGTLKDMPLYHLVDIKSHAKDAIKAADVFIEQFNEQSPNEWLIAGLQLENERLKTNFKRLKGIEAWIQDQEMKEFFQKVLSESLNGKEETNE